MSKLKSTALLVIVAIVFGFLGGAAYDKLKGPDRRGGSSEWVDESGRVRLAISAKESGPRIEFMGADEKARGVIELDGSDSLNISQTGADGKRRMLLSSRGPELSFSSEQGGNIRLGAKGGNGSLSLASEDGTHGVFTGLDEKGLPTIDLYGPTSRIRLLADADDPRVEIIRDGRVVWSASASPVNLKATP